MGQPQENETENFDVVTSETDVIQVEAGEKPIDVNEQKQEGEGSEATPKGEEAEKKEGESENEELEKPAAGTGAEKKRSKNRFQKRIDRKVKQAADANKRADETEAENARLKKELEQAKAGNTGEAEEPEPSDFEDYYDYLKALDTFNGKEPEKEAEPKAKVEPEEEEKPEPGDEELIEALDDMDESFAAAKEKYDDFDDAISSEKNKGLIVTRDMAIAMSDADNAGDIAYFLGKNTDEASRISKLSTIAQAKEIGKLEVKLTKKPLPASKTTEAPAPIEPVGGSDATEKKPEDMSFREYEADQNAKARRGGFW